MFNSIFHRAGEFSRYILLILLISFSFSTLTYADTLKLAVQPILSKAGTEKIFQPLADYLSVSTGQAIEIQASYKFLDYWESMRRHDGFDLVLDAAHFTDYRAKNMGYTVLAKIEDTVTYSLASHEDQLVFDAEELIGKRIAATPSPSLGGVRLAELFPNPLRQPSIIGTYSANDALQQLRDKKVDAILIPTPLTQGVNTINIITTTQPVPHIALSASPNVDKTLRKKIQDALINAKNTPQGQEMLQKVNLAGFEKADNTTYQGYANLLQGVWGY